MKGVRYMVDDAGEKTAVVIDLRLLGDVWEDIYDSLIAQKRRAARVADQRQAAPATGRKAQAEWLSIGSHSRDRRERSSNVLTLPSLRESGRKSKRSATLSSFGRVVFAVARSYENRNNAMNPVTLKRLDTPDEVRTFDKGRFEIVRIGEMTIGRATYEPGWKWSLHVGPAAGAKSCMVEHVGMVVSGHAKVRMDDGREFDLQAGDFFHVAPGHDSWVVGDRPYVSLHFLGSEEYARKESTAHGERQAWLCGGSDVSSDVVPRRTVRCSVRPPWRT